MTEKRVETVLTLAVVVLGVVFTMAFISGIDDMYELYQRGCANGFYEVNMRAAEKGVAYEDNARVTKEGAVADKHPVGMIPGTLWVKGGPDGKKGYIRFEEKKMWESAAVGKFFVIKMDCRGWATSLTPSLIERDYIIVGDIKL